MREIDLHGLHKHEAIEKVHQMVEYCINDPVSGKPTSHSSQFQFLLRAYIVTHKFA
jgi:hypothetical protein